MAREIRARRYAQAVFEIALEKEQLDKWQADLEKVGSLGQDITIAAYLEDPGVRFEEKSRILGDRLGAIGPLVINLVYLLLTRGRFSILPDITTEYQHLVDEHRGIERAEVLAATPLDDQGRQKLGRHLSDIIGKKVLLEPEQVDPDLVGGVIIRVAGKLLDGSTRSKLDALKKEIAMK